ncbi:MAG: sarcosine oxidase subunit gamma family protein [Hyphomicrobiaceae bacterium]|nr:sarcosine oxidase subunit gamma family protein [Hyphomicrobiaceae bacterium]
MANATAARVPALEGLDLVRQTGVVEASDAGPSMRLACHGSAEAIATALGLELPSRVCRASVAGDCAMLRLGPEEHLVLGPEGKRQATIEAARAAGARTRGCVVDVGERSFGIVLAGARVEEVLASGCPLDLAAAAFPVGMCTRTILGKAEVMLWRTGPERFRLEAGRSFAPYVTELIALSVRGLPAVDLAGA